MAGLDPAIRQAFLEGKANQKSWRPREGGDPFAAARLSSRHSLLEMVR